MEKYTGFIYRAYCLITKKILYRSNKYFSRPQKKSKSAGKVNGIKIFWEYES